jgi:hypothetical protein
MEWFRVVSISVSPSATLLAYPVDVGKARQLLWLVLGASRQQLALPKINSDYGGKDTAGLTQAGQVQLVLQSPVTPGTVLLFTARHELQRVPSSARLRLNCSEFAGRVHLTARNLLEEPT